MISSHDIVGVKRPHCAQNHRVFPSSHQGSARAIEGRRNKETPINSIELVRFLLIRLSIPIVFRGRHLYLFIVYRFFVQIAK